MKKLLMAILILIAAACVILVWTGKSHKDIVPKSVTETLSGTPAVRAIRFLSPSKKTGRSSNTGSKLGGTATEGTTDIGSVVSRKADAKARELIAGARRFLSLGDPPNARAELEAVEGLLCSAEIKRGAETLAEKVLPLYEHVFAMEPESIDGFRIYKLRGGGKAKGWKTVQTDDTVILKLEGGGETTLQRSNIDHITAVDPEERCEDLMKMYLEQKDATDKGDAMAHYDLAVFCRKKGMDDLAVKHLKTALKIDEEVYESVGDKGAKKLYLMAVWFGSMGEKGRKKEFEKKLGNRFPSSKYIAMLKEEATRPLPQKKIPTSSPRTPAPSSRTLTPPPRTPALSSSLSLEGKGDKFYNAGIEHYRKSMPLIGTRTFDKENKLALNAFDNAVKYYEKAKGAGKTSAGIDDKITKANSLKYGCFKMSRVR